MANFFFFEFLWSQVLDVYNAMCFPAGNIRSLVTGLNNFAAKWSEYQNRSQDLYTTALTKFNIQNSYNSTLRLGFLAPEQGKGTCFMLTSHIDKFRLDLFSWIQVHTNLDLSPHWASILDRIGPKIPRSRPRDKIPLFWSLLQLCNWMFTDSVGDAEQSLVRWSPNKLNTAIPRLPEMDLPIL